MRTIQKASSQSITFVEVKPTSIFTQGIIPSGIVCIFYSLRQKNTGRTMIVVTTEEKQISATLIKEYNQPASVEISYITEYLKSGMVDQTFGHEDFAKKMEKVGAISPALSMRIEYIGRTAENSLFVVTEAFYALHATEKDKERWRKKGDKSGTTNNRLH